MREDLYNYDSLLKGVFSTKARERIKKYISDLHYRIDHLETQENADTDNIHDLYEIIGCIYFLNINLRELEALGLQRYNAKYGSQGKFIYDALYSHIIDKGIIHPQRYETKITGRVKR